MKEEEKEEKDEVLKVVVVVVVVFRRVGTGGGHHCEVHVHPLHTTQHTVHRAGRGGGLPTRGHYAWPRQRRGRGSPPTGQRAPPSTSMN